MNKTKLRILSAIILPVVLIGLWYRWFPHYYDQMHDLYWKLNPPKCEDS